VLGKPGLGTCLELAAALEASSAHPLAEAIRAAANRAAGQVRALQAFAVHSESGQGIEGSIDGTGYRLGRAAFVAAFGTGTLPEAAPDGMTPVYLGTSEGVLARFDLADALRADAGELVRRFQAQGKQLILLSGDQQCVTSRVARELGIATAIGEQLPDQKLAFVQKLQAGGAVVAMVGDGVNDAAVLRAADVSVAMGGGAALAQLHADCVLMAGRLAGLSGAALTAGRTLAVIRQNLWWASGYNLLAIPAAAFGLLNPWMAGIGMSASSAIVVINALRLRRAKA